MPAGACLQKRPEDRSSSTQLCQHALPARHATADLTDWTQRTLAKLPARGQSVRARGFEQGEGFEQGGAIEQAGGLGDGDLDSGGLGAMRL